MRPIDAPGKQAGTRLPPPLPRPSGAGERRAAKESLRDQLLPPPVNSLRLRSHPACFPSAHQLCYFSLILRSRRRASHKTDAENSPFPASQHRYTRRRLSGAETNAKGLKSGESVIP